MADLPRPGDDFGRYRIDGLLGEGGMGVVYSATDRVLGRRVALKVVSSSAAAATFLEHLAAEAAALARVECSRVVTIYDHGEHAGCPYLVTQYVAGGDLGALLRTRGPLPPPTAAAVCAQVADALAAAHRVGVVHCDVKPSNVLLHDADAERPSVYLCDFGIARSGRERPGAGVSGTWAYLAPEVRRGQPASPASDIYALGCLLWATLIGSPPEASPYAGVAAGRATVRRVAGRGPFSRRLNRVLSRCLAPTPGERYADAAELRAELEVLAATPCRGVRAGGITRDGPHRRSGRASGRRRRAARRRPARALVAALATGVLGLAAAGAVGATGARLPWRVGIPAASEAGVGEPGNAVTPATRAPGAGVDGTQGDLDGDGFGDIAFRLLGSGGGRAREHTATYLTATWLSTGKRFQAPSIAPSPRRGGELHLLRGDVDGDGRADLVLVAQRRRVVDIMVALGRADPAERDRASADPASFGPARRWATLATSPGVGMRAAIGDVTGDGRADLVYLAEPPASPRRARAPVSLDVLSSDGSSFRHGPARALTTPGRDPGRVLVADVDGDGRPEVVVITCARARAYADVLTTGGTLGRPEPWVSTPLDLGVGGRAAVALSDVDGDGRADLVLAGQRARGQVVVRVGRSEGDRFAAPTTWGRWPGHGPPASLVGPDPLTATP